MSRNKMNILISCSKNKKDTVYATIGFQGGFVTKNYLIDNSIEFTGNDAFYNILFDYFTFTMANENIQYEVEDTKSFITCSLTKDRCAEELTEILKSILNCEYNEETFKMAKNHAKEAFSNNYKYEAFRARLKSYEISDLHRNFKLIDLIKDIENIDYAKFIECTKMLVCSSNMYIYINGPINDNNLELLKKINHIIDPNTNHDVVSGAVTYDPSSREDMHILDYARNQYYLGVLAFDFMNDKATSFAKMIVLDIYSQLLGRKNTEINLDQWDASIVFEIDQLKSYKQQFRKISKEDYEDAHKRALTKYLLLFMNGPEMYSMLGAYMLINGTDIDQYIKYINTMCYETFIDIVQRADCKITEAQIVLRKA